MTSGLTVKLVRILDPRQASVRHPKGLYLSHDPGAQLAWDPSPARWTPDPKLALVYGEDDATAMTARWPYIAGCLFEEDVPTLLDTAKAVLRHVEDPDAPRVGNQCTLCFTYRQMLRDAIEREEEKPGL